MVGAHKIETINETVMVAFFTEKSKAFKPSTMWSEYSKLKSTIALNRDVDISKFSKVTRFLKRKQVGHVYKKSKVLRFDDFCKFIGEANDNENLLLKVKLKKCQQKSKFLIISLRWF